MARRKRTFLHYHNQQHPLLAIGRKYVSPIVTIIHYHLQKVPTFLVLLIVPAAIAIAIVIVISLSMPILPVVLIMVVVILVPIRSVEEDLHVPYRPDEARDPIRDLPRDLLPDLDQDQDQVPDLDQEVLDVVIAAFIASEEVVLEAEAIVTVVLEALEKDEAEVEIDLEAPICLLVVESIEILKGKDPVAKKQ